MTDAEHSSLVLALVREAWDEAAALVEGRSLDPAAFVQVARRCEIPSWLHVHLTRNDRWPLVGEDVRDRLAAIRHKIRNDNLLLLARLEQALDGLSAQGVTPILLKGADTLTRFYEGFDERMLVDIDILVRREELPAAFRALEQAGWRAPAEPARSHYIRGSHHLPLDGPGPVVVDLELHWNLVQERRYTLDPAALFARALPTEINGRPALRLADEDAVAHLVLHHFSHYFDQGLKSLIDLRHLSREPGFDWAQVVERLREWGGTVAAGSVALHVRKLWPELLPAPIVPMIPLAPWRRALIRPLRSNHPLELVRNHRSRRVQLWLATAMLEKPASLPGWLLYRSRRDRETSDNPLDQAPSQSRERT